MKGFGEQHNSKNKKNKNTKPPKEKIIHKAFKAHSEGNISEAAKYYKEFINQGFKDYRVFSNYGEILRQHGKYKESVEFYKKAIKLKPDFTQAYLQLGDILKGLGQLKESEISYRKAIKINPNFANAHSKLGNILKEFGKPQEAEISYRKAIEINPDFALAHYNLGNVLKEFGKLQEAETSYSRAIEINPNLANAHCNLGNILKEYGKLQEAEISYRKAIEINPDFALAFSNLGNVLQENGKLKEAEISILKAIQLKPNFAVFHYNLGQILNDIGKAKEAESSLLKAIEIKPDFADAAWNLYGLSKSIKEAEERLNQCLMIDTDYLKAKLSLSAIKLHQGDHTLFNQLIESNYKDHSFIRSIKWSSSLQKKPKIFFNKWALLKSMINQSKKDRPFYEFGVWRGASFKYLIKTFKKGYGFDSFEGLPEDWHETKKGSYSADGLIPKIEGGTFIAGKFEDTLPSFFTDPRPIASIIHFDADLYSSTLCALNYSKPVIDKDTILIFDEFIINQNWEQDEFKALNEFCSNNNLTYEILAISYFTKQVAVKLLGIN